MQKKQLISCLLGASLLLSLVPPSYAAEQSATVFEEFITVNGTKLMEGDEQFKFASINYPQALTDSPWEQENALETIVAMEGLATRTYTIPVYNGVNADTAYVTGVDEEGKLTFNDDVLVNLDHLLALANEHGVRLIIPLVDHWHWIGGMDAYVSLTTNEYYSSSAFDERAWEFYTSDACMDYFKQMLDRLMNRENTVTGVLYKDDPAVMVWETGNELGAYEQEQRDEELTDWTNEVVAYLKEDLEVQQLILDGRMSMTERSLSEENLSDVLGAHYYTGNFVTKAKDDSIAATEAGKPFILGEFGSYTKAEDCEAVFQSAYEAGASGVMMWSLRAHLDGYGYYWHDENPGNWASYHWPGFPSGDYYDESNILRVIYKYGQLMQGKSGTLPIPAPSQTQAPLLYDIDSIADIQWRGVVGGAWYEIQRTEDSNPSESSHWVTVAGNQEKIHDGGREGIRGYHDVTGIDRKSYSYRLRAVNESGTGLWSNYVSVSSANHVVVDDFDLIAVSKHDTNPTENRNTYSYNQSTSVSASNSILKNSSDSTGFITYFSGLPMEEIAVKVTSSTKVMPEIYGSQDNVTYTKLDTTQQGDVVTATGDMLYVRIVLAGDNQCQLEQAQITYSNQGVSVVEPNIISQELVQDDFANGSQFHAVSTKNLKQVPGLGYVVAETGTGELIYRSEGDMSSYRVKTTGSAEQEVNVSVSSDGIHYEAVPANDSHNQQVTFQETVVTGDVKYLKVSLSGEGSISSVELASGSKRIPILEFTPENVLEDGEMYFGTEENLENSYHITTDPQQVVFAKELGCVDYTPYDVLYAWIQGDGSGNTLHLELLDETGEIWRGNTILGTESGMTTFVLGDYPSDIDFSKVSEFRLTVEHTNEDVPSGTFYVDSISLGSLTKIDDYESYNGSDVILNEHYIRNSGGGLLSLSLTSEEKSEQSYGMKITYDYNGQGYAGATKNLDKMNLKDYDGIRFWYTPDGSNNSITYQLTMADGNMWEAVGYMNSTQAVEVYLPFESFKAPSWDPREGSLDPSLDMKAFSIYTNQNGEVTSGTFYLDDIRGFHFKEDLEAATVSMDEKTSINSFPATLQGSATYVNYVSVKAGEKMVNVPVIDGKWTVTMDDTWGIYNTDSLEITASINNFEGNAIKSDSIVLTLAVEGNDFIPPVEKENLLKNGDFTSLNDNQLPNHWTTTEGFKMEDGALLYWTQEDMNISASQVVSDISTGSYALEVDFRAKSNVENAGIRVIQGGEVVFEKTSIDTEDSFTNLLFEGISLSEGEVEIVFFGESKGNPDGMVFAVKKAILSLEQGTKTKSSTLSASIAPVGELSLSNSILHAGNYAVEIHYDFSNTTTEEKDLATPQNWYDTGVDFLGEMNIEVSPEKELEGKMLENTLNTFHKATGNTTEVSWGTTLFMNDLVSREETLAVLYHYAEILGKDSVSSGESILNHFADKDEVSPDMLSAVAWAVDSGLVSGKQGNQLDPTGITTQGELSIMLLKFVS